MTVYWAKPMKITSYHRSKQLGQIAIIGTVLALFGCGGGSTNSTADAGPTAVAGVSMSNAVASISATPAVITKGDNSNQVYTTTLTAKTASGDAATLQQSKFAAPVYVDVPASTTFGLSPSDVPGQYKLVVSSTVGGSGLPVAVAGVTTNLKDMIYYNETAGRITFEVPIVLSCSQPAYVASAKCQSTSSGGASSTTVSSGSNSSSGTGSSSGGSAASRSFISWNGSSNGEIVKDANNEDFAFYADTRCLYSFNRQSETSNFCLFANSASGSFAGRAISVISARSTTGSCIAVMIDPVNGNTIDIVTSAAGVQTVTVSTTRPTGC